MATEWIKASLIALELFDKVDKIIKFNYEKL